MTGTSYAWNWSGVQSLWIDFRGATDVISADFAFFSPSYSEANASTIQLFGYDAANALVAASAVDDLPRRRTDLAREAK